jgi:hypothetical protein
VPLVGIAWSQDVSPISMGGRQRAIKVLVAARMGTSGWLFVRLRERMQSPVISARSADLPKACSARFADCT